MGFAHLHTRAQAAGASSSAAALHFDRAMSGADRRGANQILKRRSFCPFTASLRLRAEVPTGQRTLMAVPRSQ
jgi:hypothetical protein